MKKIFALGWMLVAALALTNCSKEEAVAPEMEDQAFELFANAGGSRTTMADLKTSWVANDAMNVWTATADGYQSHGQFTISDVENGKFTGTLDASFDNTTANDWYVIYPYSSYGLMPVNSAEAGTWMYVGHSTPKQNGNNSQAHLSGSSAPLYGIAKNVAGSETPVFQMHHLSTFVRVRVTNNTEAPFSVASIFLTSENELALAGSYYLDITSEAVAYKPSQVKTEVTLTVNNGEEIAVGEQAEFYLPLAPIQFGANDEMLTVNIKTTEGATISVEKTIPGGTKFAAGKLNTLNAVATVDNTEYPEATGWPIITNSELLINGAQVVIAASDYDYACGSQSTYYRTNVNVTKGDNSLATADEATEIFNVVKVEGENGAYYALQSTKSNAGMFLYAPTGGSNNMLTQKINSHNSFWKIAVTAAGKATITNVANNRVIQYNVGSPRFSTYSSASQAAVSLFLVKEGDNTNIPVFSASATETSLVCDATEASFSVMGNVAWTAEITSGNASFSKEGTTTTLNGDNVADVNLYFDGNTDTENKKIITIKVTTTEDVDTKEYTLTYSLEVLSTAKYYTKVTEALEDWSGRYLLVEEKTSPAKALSSISTTSTKYGIGTDVEIENSQIRYSDNIAAYEVTITKVDGGYNLGFKNSYLTWVSGNSLTTASSGNIVWSIVWDATSKYTKITNNNTPARQIWWNVNSPRFACYTGKTASDSAYGATQLYKLSE